MSKYSRKSLLPKKIIIPREEPVPPPIVMQTPEEPIPPPIVRKSKSAPVSSPSIKSVVTKIHSEERICDCCGEHISKKAIKCPHCKEWRRDIKKGLYKRRIILTILTICSLPIGPTFVHKWPRQKYVQDIQPYSWHTGVKDISTKELLSGLTMKGAAKVAEEVGDYFGPRYRLQFSVDKFLKSPSGWFIIIDSIFSIFMACAYMYISNELKRKGCSIVF